MRLVLWLHAGGAWHGTRGKHILMACHTINSVSFLALFSLRLQFYSAAALFVAFLEKIIDPSFGGERGKKRTLHRKATTACSSEAAEGSQGCAAVSGLCTLWLAVCPWTVLQGQASCTDQKIKLQGHCLCTHNVWKRSCCAVRGFCISLAVRQ